MTLLRLIQRASILAGMTFVSLSAYSNPAHADTPQLCVIANNGKTVCGTLKAVERACVTTDGSNTICGKFKSASEGQSQQSRQPTPVNSSRTVVNNVAFLSKGCSRSDTNVKCSFSIRNKGTERDFYPSQSTITDSSGKTYRAFSIEMGGQTATYAISMKIAPEIDYEATLTFNDVPGGITKVQVFSFAFDNKTVNLRNITISN